MTKFRDALFAAAAIAAAGSALAVSPPAHANVKAGVDAWSVGDYDSATAQWRSAAEAGDADAQFNMAQAYRLGRGVAEDFHQAEVLYLRAAAQGHLKAADNYGLLLFQDGRREQAMPYIRAASERGDPRAQYFLGIALFNGDPVEKDWERAHALLTMAKDAGLPQAGPALSQMDRFISHDEPQTQDSVNQPKLAMPTPLVRRAAAAKPDDNGRWRVQLGAFSVPGNAQRLWTLVSDMPALSGKQRLLVPAGRLTLLQADGFASRSAAQSACTQLKHSGQECIATR